MNEKIKKYRLQLFLKYKGHFKKTDYKSLFKLYQKSHLLFLKKLEVIFKVDLKKYYNLKLNTFLTSKRILSNKYPEEEKALLITLIIYIFCGFFFEEKMLKKLSNTHQGFILKRSIKLDDDGIDALFYSKREEYFYQFKYLEVKEKDIIKFKEGIKKYGSKNKKIKSYIISKNDIIEM